jgi:hypothetical protein
MQQKDGGNYMRWVGYVACMRITRRTSENPKGRDHLGDLDVDGRII